MMTSENTTAVTAVCVCGHDDVTHALRLRRHSNVLGAEWTECLAALPGWECSCALFTAAPELAPVGDPFAGIPNAHDEQNARF